MCYCESTHRDPKFMRRHGIRPGFCGICRECGKPGHARHSPIPAPFTGAWCDECYDALGDAYDAWRLRNPEGYTTDFMEEWRQAHPGISHQRRGLAGLVRSLFHR